LAVTTAGNKLESCLLQQTNSLKLLTYVQNPPQSSLQNALLTHPLQHQQELQEFQMMKTHQDATASDKEDSAGSVAVVDEIMTCGTEQPSATFNDPRAKVPEGHTGTSEIRMEPTAPSDEQQSVPSTRAQEFEEAWNRMFDGLVAYEAKHGTFSIPGKMKIMHDGKDLGLWVANQRRFYNNAREGKSRALSADRIEKLENIGFNFDARRGPRECEQMWDNMLAGLAQFYNDLVSANKCGTICWQVWLNFTMTTSISACRDVACTMIEICISGSMIRGSITGAMLLGRDRACQNVALAK
jgi:hypothetical protein